MERVVPGVVRRRAARLGAPAPEIPVEIDVALVHAPDVLAAPHVNAGNHDQTDTVLTCIRERAATRRPAGEEVEAGEALDPVQAGGDEQHRVGPRTLHQHPKVQRVARRALGVRPDRHAADGVPPVGEEVDHAIFEEPFGLRIAHCLLHGGSVEMRFAVKHCFVTLSRRTSRPHVTPPCINHGAVVWCNPLLIVY